MIDAELGPLAVESAHGRLRGDLLLSHTMDPTTSVVVWINVAMAAIIIVVAAIALFRRDRFRSVTLSLTRMLTALAPLLAVYAAGTCLFPVLLDQVDPAPADVDGMTLALAEGTFSIVVGAAAGAVGAVLTAILSIVPVRGIGALIVHLERERDASSA